MYSIKRAKYKGNVIGKIELEGFLMGLNGKVYKIGGADVSDISISDKSLAEPIVTSQVMKIAPYSTDFRDEVQKIPFGAAVE